MKKIDTTNLVKIAGRLVVAAGYIMTSWASDKATQKQNDENFEKYISEKESEES